MPKVLDLLKQESAKAIEEAKRRILAEKIESKRAYEALQFYVTNWDDTTHPGFLGLGCEAVGGDLERAVPMQVVMLYLTAAMDLHDDVIDGSDVKNGRPTVYGKYGKAISLLLGNAMMLKGFMLLYDYGKRIPPEAFEKVIHTIQTYFFSIGNAHLLEDDLKGLVSVPPKRYLAILEKKSATIEVHTRIGAMIGGSSSDEIEDISRYGKILGMLIGLREEFADVFEPKELQNRMKNEVLPLPLLYALRNAGTRDLILEVLSKPRISEKDAGKIVKLVFQGKEVKNLREYMQDLADEALSVASKAKERNLRESLTLIARGALEDL